MFEASYGHDPRPSPSSIAVIAKDSYSVLEAGTLPQLVTRLSDEDSEVRIKSCRLEAYSNSQQVAPPSSQSNTVADPNYN